MSDAKFDGADMTEVVMSKAYAVGASFKGEKKLFILALVGMVPCTAIYNLLIVCPLKCKFIDIIVVAHQESKNGLI